MLDQKSEPEFEKTSFICPHCNVFSEQKWFTEVRGFRKIFGFHATNKIKNMRIAICTHCQKYSIWLEDEQKMIYPERISNVPPNPDLPEEIKKDFEEARLIVFKSPRGAAALIRLCIQKLCKHLGETGKNINDDIKSLVKKGLPVSIQNALDIVRVIGNKAVHPGMLELKDDVDTANKLIELVNFITDYNITKPKEIKKLFNDKIPENIKSAIKNRDKKE